MQLIASEKQRMLTFKKRKDGLFKKVHELTTLCGVKACAVVYGPNSSSKAETWPPDQDGPNSVRQLFDVYKARKRDLGPVRNYGVSDFFEERKKKAEDELHRLRKENMESKYPSWFECLDSYDENGLRWFGDTLKNKIDRAAWRIVQLKETERELAGIILSPSNNLLFSDDRRVEQQQGLSYPVNHQDPAMMMMAMKNNNYEIPPHRDHQTSNVTKNSNEIPPHHHNQIGYTNYGQQGGAFVNGTASSRQLDLVLSSHQSQQGCLQMQRRIIPQFESQIPYMRQSMPMNVSVPVLTPQAPYLQQNHLISNNNELPAAAPVILGWDLERGNGGLEDIVACMRRRR